MSKFAISVILGSMLCLTLAACSRPPSAAPSGEIAEKGEAIVVLLAKEDFAGVAKEFDATMQKGLSVEQLGETWRSLALQYGAFREIQEARAGKEQGYDVAYVTTKFEKGLLMVKVVFDNQQKIGGLWITPAN
jgi:hypothetical protein